MEGKRISAFSQKTRLPLLRREGITILYYHSIDGSGSVISTSPSQFLRQMQFLKRRRFQVLSLVQLTDLLRTKEPLPSKTVVITFDDGYQNNYHYAFPVLQEFGFPATVFIATKYCGQTNDWPQLGFVLPSLAMLSWAEIREMSRFNIEMGCHTHSHPNLVEAGPEETREEILLSKGILEEKVGNPVRFFAYPYGTADRPIKEIVASEFVAACSTQPGRVDHRSDLYSLERVDAGYGSHLLVYRTLISPACNAFFRARPWMWKVVGSCRWRR